MRGSCCVNLGHARKTRLAHQGLAQHEDFTVNRAELIEHIAREAEISKAAASRALEAFTAGVRRTLKQGGSVQIVGFGSFDVGHRAGRTGRNPRTGESVTIAAARVPKFKPGKHLKDALN
jgi:DNA-binding protein HU-beta